MESLLIWRPKTGEILFHDGFNEEEAMKLKIFHSKEIATFMIIVSTNEIKNCTRKTCGGY